MDAFVFSLIAIARRLQLIAIARRLQSIAVVTSRTYARAGTTMIAANAIACVSECVAKLFSV